MARIIAGDAGSIPLKVPQGPTRPTSDRVREALFSSLLHRIDLADAVVVDLYAGSGALGLEALSRGARKLIAVESHRGAAEVIRENARVIRAAIGRELDIHVEHKSVSAFLSSHPQLGGVDVVFMDPPYDLSNDSVQAALVDLERLVDPGTLIVVERRAHRDTVAWPQGFAVLSEKVYGDTAVTTLEVSR